MRFPALAKQPWTGPAQTSRSIEGERFPSWPIEGTRRERSEGHPHGFAGKSRKTREFRKNPHNTDATESHATQDKPAQ
jgi:hypothetical protein